MDVSLRWLRYFVAVAEHSSFTRAAQALFVSQPVLSKQIRALEDALGVELFVRSRRGTRLSEAGRALLPGAIATLRAWEDARSALVQLAATAASTVTVGLHIGVERALLPRVRQRLAITAPDLKLKLRHASWSDASGGLLGPAEDSVDAAFVFLPLPASDAAHLSWDIVGVEPRRLLVSTQHRFARQQVVALADLDKESFIALPVAAGPLREHFLGAPERDVRDVRIAETVESPDEVVEAVTANLGVTLIAAGNVQTFHREGIAVVDVAGLSPSTLALAWRSVDNRLKVRLLADAVRISLKEA